MSLALQRLKVYSRITLVVAVILLAAIILFMNRTHTVRVWFFGITDPEKPVNVVWVILWTVLITRTTWWLISFGHGLWRDWRMLQREQDLENVIRTQKQEQKRGHELTGSDRPKGQEKSADVGGGPSGLTPNGLDD